MIGFAEKMYLHAGWLIPGLIFGYLLQVRVRNRWRRRLGEPQVVRKLLSGESGYRNELKFGLIVAAYGAMVLALARPQLQAFREVPAGENTREIVFAVDVSNSMLAADVLPNRLIRARSLLGHLLESLPGHPVGLVVFAGKAYPYLPITEDHENARAAIKSITPELAGFQGSSLREALKISALLLQQKNGKPKTLCLISDGESHQRNFAHLADSLARSGVQLITIGVGSETGERVPVTNEAGLVQFKIKPDGQPVISRLQAENLKRLVQSAPGNYLQLQTNEQVTTSFLQLLKEHDARPGTRKTVQKELYPHFILLAILLLVAEFLIPPAGRVRIKI